VGNIVKSPGQLQTDRPAAVAVRGNNQQVIVAFLTPLQPSFELVIATGVGAKKNHNMCFGSLLYAIGDRV